MKDNLTISLDVMGGDNGVETVLGGAEIALERSPDTKFLLFGQEEIVGPALKNHPKLLQSAEFFHCEIAGVQAFQRFLKFFQFTRWAMYFQ